MTESTRRIERQLEDDGRLLCLRWSAGRGNVLDRALIAELREALVAPPPRARALVLDHGGPDFSWGSSIPEHLPGQIEEALPEFHALVRELAAWPLPLLFVLRGRCLGGGLELACCADRIFAGRDVVLAQPEIQLGVLAPVASLLLRERVGEAAARDLLLSGRSLRAREARRLGLVDEVAADPAAAARSWFRRGPRSSSPSSLGFATRAARWQWSRAVLPELAAIERLYLDELMASPDAEEGLRAFLERRLPRWRDGP